jgi:hypothetical protein
LVRHTSGESLLLHVEQAVTDRDVTDRAKIR